MTPGNAELLDAWLAGRAAGHAIVVVAHPDDEVLGCGALLARLADVTIVHVTDGAPRDGGDARRHGFASPADYATARADEARAALALAGVSANRVSTFGVPDQEVSQNMPEVVSRLGPRLAGAGLVLTHAFEGGHSDHDAVAFAVHAAWAATPQPRALLVEMPFYHAAADGWRRQAFLPHVNASPHPAGSEHVLVLSSAEQDLKARMVAAHRSQAETLRSFDLSAERFRVAPVYDFTRRPHGGDLLYERHGWSLDWPTWVTRVRCAEAELGVMRP